MTAHVLISGSIFREAQQRTSQAGKRYVVATLKTTDNSASDFWSIMCFSESAGAELLRLGLNEKLAVQGSLKLEIFEKNGEAKIGRTVFADHVMALRQPRKAKAATLPNSGAKPASTAQETTTTTPTGAPPFDDDVPF